MRQVVDEGAAESQNAFVERALVRELRRRRVYDAYAEAADDASFTAEMEEVSREFEPTTGDGLEDRE